MYVRAFAVVHCFALIFVQNSNIYAVPMNYDKITVFFDYW